MSQFREGKSLVVAVCMGIITSDTPMFFYCHDKNSVCSDSSIRTKAQLLAILYQFFRETVCDVRDMEEDIRDGMDTLPIRLGRFNTLLSLFVLGTFADTLLTGGIWIDLELSGTGVLDMMVRMQMDLVIQSLARVGLTVGFFIEILRYPRSNSLAWGLSSLFGLVPVISAQASLLQMTS